MRVMIDSISEAASSNESFAGSTSSASPDRVFGALLMIALYLRSWRSSIAAPGPNLGDG